MEANTVEGFLVGYNKDECYRVYVPKQRKVVLSQEFKLLHSILIRQFLISRRMIEVLMRVSKQKRQLMLLLLWIIAVWMRVLNQRRQFSFGEDKVEEETTIQERELWDCSKLNITARLKDCIFVCNTENPDTYEKSIASNKAVEWKWFCSWFFL